MTTLTPIQQRLSQAITANETDEVNADFIVHAVNNHKALLRACVAALTIVNREQGEGSIANDLREAIRNAKQA